MSAAFGDARVAAGVVQGIGFLGAGLIFQRGEGVRGVTTAATIWVIVGLGLLVAEELWLSAVLLTVAVVLLLELSPLSDWVYRNGRYHRGQPDALRRLHASAGREGAVLGVGHEDSPPSSR